jgi:hypothetical protein
MKNLRRVRYVMLLAALVAGHQRLASAGTVAATWMGPDSDNGQSTDPLTISSPASTGPVTGFTGTTGPGEYFWEGSPNTITLTFSLLGGHSKSETITPSGLSYTTYELSSLFTPLSFTGTVTQITISETNPCGGDYNCGGNLYNLLGQEGQPASVKNQITNAQIFDFSTPTTVPEPASLGLMATALAGFAAFRRRRPVAAPRLA